ncbi:helix-turn-helix domain-containing protein [Sinorhizobium meliloti]|uniref:helix-turn-helix domain-containing protein n=1 Tax=Rhizobium meliloti TaxID=382 RepID=UPI001913D10B|nr:helix-turn-helix domain-containing protein [Sinorhizobium meliloti]
MSDESEALQHLRDMKRALDELITVLKKMGADREIAGIRDDRQLEKFAYSVPEAATALGLSKDYVWKLVASGKIRSLKAGKRRLIRGEDLTAFLNKRP